MRMGPESDLRVSIIQVDTIWRDAAANRKLHGELLRPLQGATDVIVLPETFTSGFGDASLDQAEGMDGMSVAWLRELSAQVGATITGSLVIRDDEALVNRLLWAEPNGALSWYDKRHLFRMANEHLRYGEGRRRILTHCRDWRVLPLVCYDLRFPVWSRNRVAADGSCEYDLAIYVANWPSPRRHAWRTLLRARAIENLACVVGVNRVGIDGEGHRYAGDSAILDPLGMPLIELGAQAQVATVTLSAAQLRAHRERFPAHRDADGFRLDAVEPDE